MDQSLDELIMANKQANSSKGKAKKNFRSRSASGNAPYNSNDNNGSNGGGGGGDNSSQACRVFVGNLSWEVTWRELKEHMSQAGAVVRADVLMGGDGRSKGCGIVEYCDVNTANDACQQLHDTELLGRKIFVREDKEEENVAAKPKTVQKTSANNSQFNPATAQTRRCYVGNLSWDVAWQDLKDHMRQAGDVVYAEVLEEDSGRSKGCGIVEYSSASDAQKAIAQLTNSELNGREIFVREDRETTPAGHKNSLSVYVGNLAFETSWQDLKDCMRAAGNVDKADILTGEDGRSKGCGIVSYQKPSEAARAIREMQNHVLHNRPIFVREDREAGKGSASCCLFVNNLDYSTDWKSLKDHFRAAGEVERADVVEGKGFGTVVFKRARDAGNAIRMLNNTNLDGRPIGVKMDQKVGNQGAGAFGNTAGRGNFNGGRGNFNGGRGNFNGGGRGNFNGGRGNFNNNFNSGGRGNFNRGGYQGGTR